MSYSNTIKDKKEEDKLLIAKVKDKFQFCNSKNKITYTDFMQLNERSIVQKFLNENRVKNYFFFGGIENADREILVFYPNKLTEELARKNLEDILKFIQIKLPLGQSYEHREYLSGIMKLGVKREKFGDIIVREDGADIVVLDEISEYFMNSLPELTRFKKAEINLFSIENLNQKEEKYESLKIIVSSMRLDNFVAELSKCSRGKAQDILQEGRVFVNGINEIKESKKIQIGDKITIRGKGKFIFNSIEKTTKSNKILINIDKYC